jgi:hypothetical protein
MENKELAESVKERFGRLEERRARWVPTWRELAAYVLPRKDRFGEANAPVKGEDRIFDSTPSHSLELLSSALCGLLTNPAVPWFDIRPADRETADREDVRTFLTEVRERMTAVFNSENTGFQTHVHELYLDVALFGSGVMYVEADPDCVVRFNTRPLGEICVAEDARGMVDTVFRRYELTARQAVQEWGDDCSDETRRLAEEQPESTVEVLHAVFPRDDRDPFGIGVINFPWCCVYLEARSGHLLEESGYLEMPYMVPRWCKTSGETYGRGPGLTALSDIRVLNAMAKTALMAAEKMSDPPLMVPDDGFLGPIRSGPGGLSYYRAGSNDRVEALPVHADLRSTQGMMEQRRESIRRIFLGDQLAPADGPAISATEAVIRQSEKMRVLGPVLGRLQTELLGPLVRRVFNIMSRTGALPPMPSGMEPEDFTVRYASPVNMAQKRYEAQGMQQAMQYLAPLMGQGDPFGLMDNFDPDRVARHAAELFGVPADYLLPEQAVAEKRNGRAQSAGQAQRSQTVERMAGIAKLFSEADMSKPNALTELIKASGGDPMSVIMGATSPAGPAPGNGGGDAA